jgi:hypothetical protein
MYLVEILEKVTKTSILKNALLFLKEVFRNGRTVRLHEAVVAKFIPIVAYKALSEKSLLRDEARNALAEFA